MSKEGMALKLRRIACGLTLRDAAQRIGWQKSSLWNWEQGIREIPDDARRELAKAYRCRVKDLGKFPLDSVQRADRMGA